MLISGQRLVLGRAFFGTGRVIAHTPIVTDLQIINYVVYCKEGDHQGIPIYGDSPGMSPP